MYDKTASSLLSEEREKNEWDLYIYLEKKCLKAKRILMSLNKISFAQAAKIQIIQVNVMTN